MVSVTNCIATLYLMNKLILLFSSLDLAVWNNPIKSTINVVIKHITIIKLRKKSIIWLKDLLQLFEPEFQLLLRKY